MTSTLTTIRDVTCLGCGCACDDIGVVVDDVRIRDTPNACPLGIAWFGDGRAPARSYIDGRDVPIDNAVLAAATMLEGSARPLVYLAPGISCETQGEAAAIADLLRARLDSVTSATALPVILSGQERGFASATLGEIRNRADVLVFWAIDLDARYPRFASRYAPEPAGTHVPDGRRSRHVIAVDIGAATSARDADRRVAFAPPDELGTLAALQALARVPANATSAVASYDGRAWAIARKLFPALVKARYLALVYDAEPDDRAERSPQRFDALASLSQALNERTRCVSVALRAGGNRSGADSVLTAQTGFPLAVDFARGYPRYAPHDAALTSLQRGDVDIALVVGDASFVPATVMEALAGVRCIAIGPRASASPLGSAPVVIDTGVAGIHDAGTALRTDDVPLPLRPPLTGPPSAAAIVASLLRAIASAQRRSTSTQPTAAAS
jgi:formylmethanofuran dehydrogenase subunit B